MRWYSLCIHYTVQIILRPVGIFFTKIPLVIYLFSFPNSYLFFFLFLTQVSFLFSTFDKIGTSGIFTISLGHRQSKIKEQKCLKGRPNRPPVARRNTVLPSLLRSWPTWSGNNKKRVHWAKLFISLFFHTKDTSILFLNIKVRIAPHTSLPSYIIPLACKPRALA